MSTQLSVIIPAYNAEPYVVAAIESVEAQGVDGIEIVVVNDGSSDGTLSVLESLGGRIRLLDQENRGISATVNRAVAESSGELLAFLDADDLWTPNRLALQLQLLKSSADPAFVFGLVEQFACPLMAPEDAARLVVPSDPMPALLRGGMLMHRADFDAVGLFDESHGASEFIEWYSRAIDSGLTPLIPQQLVLRRRIHGSNTTLVAADLQRSYLKAMRSIVKRRRAAAQAGE